MPNASPNASAFDSQGHPIGCSTWARLWEAHWGRDTLDARTLANLDEMKARRCALCVADDTTATPEI